MVEGVPRDSVGSLHISFRLSNDAVQEKDASKHVSCPIFFHKDLRLEAILLRLPETLLGYR